MILSFRLIDLNNFIYTYIILFQPNYLNLQSIQLITLRQQMQALKTCTQHNFPIQYICFEQICTNRGEQIMCQQCTDRHNTSYNSHRVIEYALFKKYLHTLRNEAKYDELKQLIKNEFVNLRKDVNKQMDELEGSMLASISLQFNEQHEYQVFQGQVTLLARNQLFTKYVLNTSSIKLVKEQVNMKNINQMKKVRSIKSEIKKIFQLEKKDIPIPKLDDNFYFSLKNKHQNIEVINNGTIIRMLSNANFGHSQLAVCRQPFSSANNKIQFHIKEMSPKGCIAIGACLLSTVQKNKFFRCWHIGEGAYSLFVNTFGTVKSNHHTSKNYSNVSVKNMSFVKGNKITVEIDFKKEQILFTKDNNRIFSMPINIGTQKLYPFAAVSYMGDVVKIG